MIKPGVSTDKVAEVWPKAEEFGFPARRRPSACSSATGWALRCTSARSSAARSRWITRWRSRPAWCSRSKPTVRQADGYSAARIEEEVVVTDTGCEVISLFPAEELPIANRY
jgi:Xaa-Pro aminopeptidase